MLKPHNKLFERLTKISQVLSAGVSLSVHSVRHKEVLTVTKIKQAPAEQLSSTGTRSKWPLNSISVLRCQIMGCHRLSTPDNAGPLPANHWACYAANCSFSVLACNWQTHSQLCLSSALPAHGQLFFLNMTATSISKVKSLMSCSVCICTTKDFVHYKTKKKSSLSKVHL